MAADWQTNGYWSRLDNQVWTAQDALKAHPRTPMTPTLIAQWQGAPVGRQGYELGPIYNGLEYLLKRCLVKQVAPGEFMLTELGKDSVF